MDYNDKPIKIFTAYIMRHKGLFAIDMTCAILASVIDIIFPKVSRTAMNEYLPQGLYKVFFTVMAVMIVAYLIKAVLFYILTITGHRLGVLTESDMRHDIFTHMQELSCSYFDKNRTGVLLSRITSDLFEVTELAHHGPENLIICTITILGTLILMFTIECRLALVVAVVFPICLWFTMANRVKMKSANIEVKKTTGEISATIESCISGIRTSKAFANEDLEEEKFEYTNERFRGAKVQFYKSMGLFMSGMEFTTGIIPVVVILVGGLLIMNKRMDYVDLVTFSLYVSVIVSPIRRLAQSVEMFMAGSAGFSRFLEIMRQEPDITDAPDAVELKDVEGHIEYKDVCFSYDNDVTVLKNVSLDILPGECFALVGPTGSGKSTICKLLPRFYDVTSGSVSVDGTDVRKITQKSLRQNIGLIEQDVFMFAGTIKDNILYGRPDATDEEIIEAAKLAEIHDEIIEFPDGYDTFIGERGVMLSGGQKQRVSIARVFLKNPKILILDEATSALDSVTERKIQSALDKLSVGRTTMVIAHRLSTIRNADKIAVVEDDRVAECGTHKKLLEKDERYAALWRAQMEVDTFA